MPDYQLCFLSARGEIERLILLECRDDEDARRLVGPYADGLDADLWTGDRLVRKYRNRERMKPIPWQEASAAAPP